MFPIFSKTSPRIRLYIKCILQIKRLKKYLTIEMLAVNKKKILDFRIPRIECSTKQTAGANQIENSRNYLLLLASISPDDSRRGKTRIGIKRKRSAQHKKKLFLLNAALCCHRLSAAIFVFGNRSRKIQFWLHLGKIS